MHSRENRNGNRQSSSDSSLNPCRTPIPTCWDARPAAKRCCSTRSSIRSTATSMFCNRLGPRWSTHSTPTSMPITSRRHVNSQRASVAESPGAFYRPGENAQPLPGCSTRWWSSQPSWLSSTCPIRNLSTTRCRETAVAGSARKTCLNRCANIASRWPRARKADPTRSRFARFSKHKACAVEFSIHPHQQLP